MTEYQRGFMDKCAEAGIDGAALLKEAQLSRGLSQGVRYLGRVLGRGKVANPPMMPRLEFRTPAEIAKWKKALSGTGFSAPGRVTKTMVPSTGKLMEALQRQGFGSGKTKTIPEIVGSLGVSPALSRAEQSSALYRSSLMQGADMSQALAPLEGPNAKIQDLIKRFRREYKGIRDGVPVNTAGNPLSGLVGSVNTTIQRQRDIDRQMLNRRPS